MIYYVNHLVKELQSIHENRLELANKIQLAMNSNTVSIHLYYTAYSLFYILLCMCIYTCICYFILTNGIYTLFYYTQGYACAHYNIRVIVLIFC